MISSSTRRIPSICQAANRCTRHFTTSNPQNRLLLPSQTQSLRTSPKSHQQSASLTTNAGTAASAPAHDKTIFQAVATGGIPYPGIPEFEDLHEKRQWQLEHLAGAFRVFARKGFTEGAAGHISVRDPIDTDTFWINPLGVHFALLTAADMVQIDEKGQVIGGNRAAVNAAGFQIHSAVHAARPDVHAACHAHSKYGKAWSAFGRPVDMLNQDSCIFWNDHSVYSSFGGVALEANEGVRIAEALGPKNRSVILQNHGLLTAGGTVDEAAYLFTLLERTCEVQLLVESAGLEKRVVEEEEAKYTWEFNADPETLYTEFQPDFQYEVWKSRGLIRDRRQWSITDNILCDYRITPIGQANSI